jgi:selenocysteine lyase/cysteine desulfurase
MMNAANLCPSPYPVIESVARLTRDVDGDASFQNRAKFSALKEGARRSLGAFIGADADEIAITRNTSEGNNTVVNGVELGRGDHVVIWDENHPTNNIAWDVGAARHGYTVTRVTTPLAPDSDAELQAPFMAALRSNTRVLAFSHVSNVSGIALPAKALCAAASARGILTLIDGAQTFGALTLDVHDIGCDFFTGSSHKWFVGPKEVGLLYVRRERVDDLWPSDVGVGWEQARASGAAKFDNLGQRDDAAVSAMGVAADFQNTIGRQAVEQRARQLAAALKRRLGERIPGIRFHTPLADELSLGVVVFVPPGHEPRQIFERLYREHNVAGAAMGGAFSGVRLSPHIYNTLEDIDRAADAVANLV